MRRVFSLSFLSILNGFWLLLLWLLQNFVGEKTGPTALLLYLPPQIYGVFPAVLLAISLLKRQPKFALWNGAGMLFWALAILGFQTPDIGKAQRKSVRIVSYNVLGKYAKPSQIAAQIRAQNPDIVCLQESQDGFGERVAQFLPGWNCQSMSDVSTLSRFRVVKRKAWHLRGTRWMMDATFQTPSGNLRVVNAHLSTSYPGQPLPVRGKWKRTRQLWETAQPSAMVRLEQLPNLQKATRGEEPTILLGDFNSPPRGVFYRAMRREWNDAFAQGGWGVGATYPAGFPLLRIDYVWMKNRVRAQKCFVVRAKGSDHLPLVCDVSW